MGYQGQVGNGMMRPPQINNSMGMNQRSVQRLNKPPARDEDDVEDDDFGDVDEHNKIRNPQAF
jgi:hypothetical protein